MVKPLPRDYKVMDRNPHLAIKKRVAIIGIINPQLTKIPLPDAVPVPTPSILETIQGYLQGTAVFTGTPIQVRIEE